MAQEVVHRVEGTVQTTDATQTVVVSYALPDECIAVVEAAIVGQQVGSANCAAYIRIVGIKRQSGLALLVGTVATPFTGENVSTWDATLTVSSPDIRVSVTGVAGVTIDWLATMTITLYQP